MAENLIIQKDGTREQKYLTLLPQIKALTKREADLIANLANITAALKQSFDFFWIGFYLVKQDSLVLGPFQGPVACTRIAKGKGVCGKVWKDKKSIIVPDVEQFPGHIACSSESKSEIVLPALKNNEVVLVLDIDSDKLNDFDQVDEENLLILMKTIEEFL